MSFKKDFVWGAATAAYQIEGAAYEDGKGLSVWDDFCKIPGKVKNGDTGDIACDHYHRYKEDVKIMKEIGLHAYRFSFSWPRIFPEGTGEINLKGLVFYDRLIDELLENGITPYATLFHWDYPSALQQKGAWLSPDSPRWFAEYAQLISKKFSDRVKHFMTFNEPQCFIGNAYSSGHLAPAYSYSLKDCLQMVHHVNLAHGLANSAMRSAASSPIQVGIANTGKASYPATDRKEDIEAAKKDMFTLRDKGDWSWNSVMYADPIYLGAYPDEFFSLYKDCLPKMGQDDMKLISAPNDFIGQNIYNGRAIAAAGGKPSEQKRYPGFPKTAFNWPVTPEVLHYAPLFIWERYQKPFYITENGLSCADTIFLDGKIHDTYRIDFLNRYLLELKKAEADGADIAGYFQWSLLDNFEWAEGYNERFGLVYVDYRTQKRALKDSAYWYQKVIASNGACL